MVAGVFQNRRNKCSRKLSYLMNISVTIGSMMAASTKILQFTSVTVLKLFSNGIPEKLNSGRMFCTRRLWTPGRLDSGRLYSPSMGAWTLQAWKLGRLDSERLDSGSLGVWTLDAGNLDDWKLGLWTLSRLDSGGLDAWTLHI